MKFSKLGLLTLLISLFILNSCKREDAIGLGVDEDTQLNGSLFVDTSLAITNIPEDSVVTSGLSTRPLAYFKDPEFGTSETNLSMILNLPGASAYTLPTGTLTVDSAVLVLPYAAGFYGDSLTSKFKVDVYQLAERIPNSSFYNSKHFTHENTLLGTKTFYARPNDSVQIANIRDDKVDTVQKVSPQIRVNITKNFVNNNLFGLPTNVLSTPTLFQNTVKGLYVTLDKSVTTGPGGIMMLNLDSVAMRVYYKRKSGSTIDTATVSLPLFNAHTEVKHNQSAKVQAALNGTSTDGRIYLEGLAGTRSKITFPNLKAHLAALGPDIVINRAELIVKAEPGTTTPYAPLTRLTLYKYDIAKQRVVLQDESSTDVRATKFGGYFNASTGEYNFLVTSFIQDYFRGKTEDYGTFLAPTVGTVTDPIGVTPSIQVAQRTILIGKNSMDKIRLNIIYTKIKK